MTAPSPFASLPDAWRDQALPSMAEGESLCAWVELDLDTDLRYARGLLILTERRLLSAAQGVQGWKAWPLHEGLKLALSDHAGVVGIELADARERLALWRTTMAHHVGAVRFSEQFERQLAALAEGGVAVRLAPACPRCHAALPPGESVCPACEDEDAESAPKGWALLRLRRFARPYRGRLIAGFILTVLSTAATLVPPYLTMPLMDDVLIPFQNGQPIDYELAGFYLSGLLAAALVAWVLGWSRTYILAWVSERIGADLRTSAYEHLQQLSLEYFGGKRTGDLMARIGNETDRICVFLSLHLLDFATDVLMILMTAAILVSIDPWLALVTLLPLPFIAWLIHLVRDKLRHGFEKVDRNWAEITNVLADTIPGIRVVKAFAQEKREVARFREANNHNLAVNDRVNTVWSMFSPTVILLTEVGLLVVWIFGIWQIANHRISVGVLAAFLAYISRFYLRLDSMSRIVSVTQKAAAGAKRIFDILDRVSSVPEPASPVPLAHVEGRIQIRDAVFRYGTRAVLRGIDLDIAPGEMIGLVGHSGSGKSTLVNLICRFYDVSQGSIKVDGVDIRALSIPEYRHNIGVVLQEPFLFFGTVAENIAYGKPHATRAEIVAAARAAHAHEFILRLPHGYDSLVGERGQALSGGERQRISIARALLIDPRILILDEATSSVDTSTEQEIQKALDNLVQGRTTIAVAHRLSTLRRADRLVVLDRGRIVEEGRHEDLIAKGGAYYRLHQAQTRQLDPPGSDNTWSEEES
ncbi:Putative multidrug export ATP-binding/permease protein [Pigmentiphaga humi]|uniref:Multidrug export ATP-binding/permease protein n=1 Tax=Pigmentiphaga humi TaxID=2478468 RepID=A0A3P4AZV6_9BURK|nr:ABC transporter ATP-binding protein [Pigmentiphaga humi]VCU69312.1 Putative multidrug export ATP-binding/permease protein [Pigmentiphaga humi]